jgi:tight adherence protein C
MSPILVSIFIFLLLAGAASAVFLAASGERRLIQARMAEIGPRTRTVAAAGLLPRDSRVTRALLKWALVRMPQPKATSARGEKIAALLIRAGFMSSMAPAVFQLTKYAAATTGVLGAVGAAMALGKGGDHLIMLAVAGAAVGAWLPGHYLGRRARNRQAEIGRQLSDVLDLLVVCVEAGLGLLGAIKVVGRETEAQNLAIGREFSMVSAEVSAGSSLGQALRGLAERTGVDDIKPLAATLIQSEQLGAAIGPALRSISDAIRTRRRMHAEEAAQRTTIKILFPLVLMILPAMLLIIVGPAIVQTMRTLSS